MSARRPWILDHALRGESVVMLDYPQLEFAGYLRWRAGWERDGKSTRTTFMYIGTQEALAPCQFSWPTMFDVGKSGLRRGFDAYGTSFTVKRYANGIWQITLDVTNDGRSSRATDPQVEATVSTILDRYRRRQSNAEGPR